ncbi:MAG: hypothetical protein ATN31_03840 [Candidatus Epulonipiscioides saccharophilum]|nr:MAG: hypothetical protein ATN31_03840 [Epulopiscium sp. AS2M-Bin001]
MRKKVSLSTQYSYYTYKNKKNYRKKMMIIAAILGFVLISYTIIVYNENNTRPSLDLANYFPLSSIGDFEQNSLAFDIHKESPNIKGLYVPAHKTYNIDNLINIANQTEINSFIIDVKDDMGYLTFSSDNKALLEVRSIRKIPKISDINALMDSLYKNNIYPIARIVTFKDNIVDTNFPERMILDSNGDVYETKTGETWLNPYDKRNWEYLLEVCKEAIKVGFKEIQFDYIRFHESMIGDKVYIPGEKDITRIEIINEFLDYIIEQLKPYGVQVSADVFGTIITSHIDAKVLGQDYKAFIKRLDAVYPMIYPSHYAPGSFGQANPDLNPYEVILGALKASSDVIRQIPLEDRKAKIIPYLQDFTATWIKPHQPYETQQLQEQIKAVYDSILTDWVFWNGAAIYTKEAFLKQENR